MWAPVAILRVASGSPAAGHVETPDLCRTRSWFDENSSPPSVAFHPIPTRSLARPCAVGVARRCVARDHPRPGGLRRTLIGSSAPAGRRRTLHFVALRLRSSHATAVGSGVVYTEIP